jgi:[ribosomal protein S5]-alanine N-acetyltransferase
VARRASRNLASSLGNTSGNRWYCTRQGHRIDFDRITLRPLVADELPEFLKLIDDEIVYQNGWRSTWLVEWTSHIDAAKTAEPKARVLGPTHFVIVLRAHEMEPETLIGSISISRDNHPFGTAEVGFWIGATHRRQGFTAEALKAICRFGFAHLHLNRIMASAAISNPGSTGALERAGFVASSDYTRTLPDGRIVAARSFEITQTESSPRPCDRPEWKNINMDDDIEINDDDNVATPADALVGSQNSDAAVSSRPFRELGPLLLLIAFLVLIVALR